VEDICCNTQLYIPEDTALLNRPSKSLKASINLLFTYLLSFSLTLSVLFKFDQTGSGVHPTSYPMSTGGSFPKGKAAGTWSWQLISIQCQGQGSSDLYVHSPIRLHGIVLNQLSKGATSLTLMVGLCDHHAFCVSANPPYQLLNGWTNLYETWQVYHGTWTHLNCIIPPISLCVYLCIPLSLLGNGLVKTLMRLQIQEEDNCWTPCFLCGSCHIKGKQAINSSKNFLFLLSEIQNLVLIVPFLRYI
jgi:hypothetical protein